MEARVPGVSAGSISSRSPSEQLDHDCGALIRVVENLDALGRDVDGRTLVVTGVEAARRR
jgi:hypothetical protein